MNYPNFKSAITEKHGIVIYSWPLEKFALPSDIGCRVQLETLLYAWQSGVTYFKKLSDVEQTANREQDCAARLWEIQESVAPTPPVTGSEAVSRVSQTDSSSLPAEPSSPPTLSPSAGPIIGPIAGESNAQVAQPLAAPPAAAQMAVFMLNSGVLEPNKKKHKERSDKGKPCGSYKRAKHTTGPEATEEYKNQPSSSWPFVLGSHLFAV